jgi:hypothetical protein
MADDSKSKPSTKPRTPTPADINRVNGEFWAKKGTAFNKLVESRPEYVKGALGRIRAEQMKGSSARQQSTIEELVFEAYATEKEIQSNKAKRPRTKRGKAQDTIDAIIATGIKRGNSTKEIWAHLINEAASGNQYGDLRIFNNDTEIAIVVADSNANDGERIVRRISETSFATTVSRTSKKLNG